MIAMMTDQTKVEDQNEYSIPNHLYQIHEIRFDLKQSLTFPFEHLKSINENLAKKLFIISGTDLFEIDLTNLYIFVENGSVDSISKANAFPQEMVFRIPN